MVIKDILPGDDESLPYEIREMLSEVMIPISFALKNGEEAVVWALEPLIGKAQKLDGLLNTQNPDIGPILTEIEGAAASYAETLGYELSAEDTGISYVFAPTDNIIPLSNLPAHLTEEDYSENSAFDFYYDGIEAFGIKKDGTVVSAASTNPDERDETNPFYGYTEIGVETLEGHRGNSYASMCLSSLATYLTEQGKQVMYVCSDKNVSSVKTAKKAGFAKVGTMYFCVCRIKE